MTARHIATRLLFAIPSLFGVALIVFILLRVVPGDPIAMMAGVTATPEQIQELRALYGLDEPLLTQFWKYLGSLAHGDLGTSITRRLPVGELILDRLPATIELSVLAMIVAISLGIALAVAATYWRGRAPERATDGFAALGLAIPDFLWGLLFILLLGVLWPILPVSGRIDPSLSFSAASGLYLIESFFRGEFEVFASVASRMVLPTLSLALPLAAIIARVLKSSLAEAMQQDYVMLARVKGFGRFRIITRDALRNALVPTVTLTAVQFTFLIGGTVLVERIFSYPGLGAMAIEAVINRDLPLIQGVVLVFAVIFIALNLIIDLTYGLLNPRLRHG